MSGKKTNKKSTKKIKKTRKTGRTTKGSSSLYSTSDRTKKYPANDTIIDLKTEIFNIEKEIEDLKEKLQNTVNNTIRTHIRGRLHFLNVDLDNFKYELENELEELEEWVTDSD